MLVDRMDNGVLVMARRGNVAQEVANGFLKQSSGSNTKKVVWLDINVAGGGGGGVDRLTQSASGAKSNQGKAASPPSSDLSVQQSPVAADESDFDEL